MTYDEWRVSYDRWPRRPTRDDMAIVLTELARVTSERDYWRDVADWWASTAPVPDPAPDNEAVS